MQKKKELLHGRSKVVLVRLVLSVESFVVYKRMTKNQNWLSGPKMGGKSSPKRECDINCDTNQTTSEPELEELCGIQGALLLFSLPSGFGYPGRLSH